MLLLLIPYGWVFSEQKCPLATLVSLPFWELFCHTRGMVNQGELYNFAIYVRSHPLTSAVLLSLLAVVHNQF